MASAAFLFGGNSVLLEKLIVAADTAWTAELDDLAGVETVEWSIETTDGLSVPADWTTVPAGPKGSQVSGTSHDATGSAAILLCIVNANIPDTRAEARAKISVLTSAGLEVGCFGETDQSDPDWWSTLFLNAAIRAVPASVGVTSVSGTPPINSSGGATPDISIDAASGSGPGSMSIAHYNAVNNATASYANDQIAKYGASGQLTGAWISLGASPAADGDVRLSSTAVIHGAGTSLILKLNTNAMLSLTDANTFFSSFGGALIAGYISGSDSCQYSDGVTYGAFTPSTRWYTQFSTGTASPAIDLNARTGLPNIGFFGVAGTDGDGVITLYNSSSVPSSDPASGSMYLYLESDAFKGRGSSSTITTIAPAEPHCPRCGMDFAIAYENPRYGKHIAICWLCFTDTLEAAGIDAATFTFDARKK